MRPKKLLPPLLWISLTYLVTTYGAEIISKVKGKDVLNQNEAQVQTEESVTVLGEGSGERSFELAETDEAAPEVKNQSSLETSSSPPTQLPQYIKEIIEKTTIQVIEKSTQEVEEKKEQVTTNVCRELISEIEKQCQAIIDKDD